MSDGETRDMCLFNQFAVELCGVSIGSLTFTSEPQFTITVPILIHSISLSFLFSSHHVSYIAF